MDIAKRLGHGVRISLEDYQHPTEQGEREALEATQALIFTPKMPVVQS